MGKLKHLFAKFRTYYDKFICNCVNLPRSKQPTSEKILQPAGSDLAQVAAESQWTAAMQKVTTEKNGDKLDTCMLLARLRVL